MAFKLISVSQDLKTVSQVDRDKNLLRVMKLRRELLSSDFDMLPALGEDSTVVLSADTMVHALVSMGVTVEQFAQAKVLDLLNTRKDPVTIQDLRRTTVISPKRQSHD